MTVWLLDLSINLESRSTSAIPTKTPSSPQKQGMDGRKVVTGKGIRAYIPSVSASASKNLIWTPLNCGMPRNLGEIATNLLSRIFSKSIFINHPNRFLRVNPSLNIYQTGHPNC